MNVVESIYVNQRIPSDIPWSIDEVTRYLTQVSFLKVSQVDSEFTWLIIDSRKQK